MEKAWFYEILFFEVVTVIVKDEKCIIKDIKYQSKLAMITESGQK